MNNENKALDALIALTLKECDVSDDQLQKDVEYYLKHDVKLKPKYKKALEKRIKFLENEK